jgi:hypothetical protein
LIGYWESLVFYNPTLIDTVYPEQQDSISAKGLFIRYIGSDLLVINLGMIMKPKLLESQEQMELFMRYSFVMVCLVGTFQSVFLFPKGNKITIVKLLVVFNG